MYFVSMIGWFTIIEIFLKLFPMRKCKLLSCVWLFATPWTIQSMEFSSPTTGLGSLSFLQGIFPTQGSNPGLPHCRRILYQLSHRGSPRILEWGAYSFSRGPSQSKNWTGSPACTVMSFDSSQDACGDEKHFMSAPCTTCFFSCHDSCFLILSSPSWSTKQQNWHLV